MPDTLIGFSAYLWVGTVTMSIFLAAAKGRNPFFWFIWSALFNVIALLALIGAPDCTKQKN